MHEQQTDRHSIKSPIVLTSISGHIHAPNSFMMPTLVIDIGNVCLQ
jgi:hypothetical protein